MRCCKCDWKLPDDAKFCSKCRAPQTSEPAYGSTKPCVNCGQLLRPNARFCSRCSVPQAADAAAVADTVADAPDLPSVPELDSDRCSACGHHLKPEDSACGVCSAPRGRRAADETAPPRPPVPRAKPADPTARDAGLPTDIARYQYLWSPDWTATCPTCRDEWGPQDIPCHTCDTYNLWSFNNRWEYRDGQSWHLELRCTRCRTPTVMVSCPHPHGTPIFGIHLVTIWSYPNPLLYFPYLACAAIFFIWVCVTAVLALPLFLSPFFLMFFFPLTLSHLLPWARTLGHRAFPHWGPVRLRLANPNVRDGYRRQVDERPFV